MPDMDPDDVRLRLDQAWHAIIRRTTENGLPRRVVIETMLEVGIEHWISIASPLEVANYLQLLAQQVIDRDAAAKTALVTGDLPGGPTGL